MWHDVLLSLTTSLFYDLPMRSVIKVDRGKDLQLVDLTWHYFVHQGHNSPREFIVTQGPLHSTRDDFWRMVWESNSRAIVMLTRCIEKGREKCDHYWPVDTHPVYYGDICVTILNETHYPDWSITEFMLCRVSNLFFALYNENIYSLYLFIRSLDIIIFIQKFLIAQFDLTYNSAYNIIVPDNIVFMIL